MIDILAITSTNNREKNSNFHPHTFRTYLYHNNKKMERSEVLLIRHTTKFPTQLQNIFLLVLS